jgi:hypothetical protein
LPATSGLSPNFPNPFNTTTQIVYRFVDRFQTAGFYQVRWDARDQRGTALAAGVYLVRLHYLGGETALAQVAARCAKSSMSGRCISCKSKLAMYFLRHV